LYALVFVSPLCQAQQLLFCVNDSDVVQNSFVMQNNVKKIMVIFQNEFVTRDGHFDSIALKKVLDKKLPFASNVQFAFLDWEGNDIHELYKLNRTSNFNNVVNNYVEAIKVAKRYRPKVKWSYYGLPPFIFNNRAASLSRINGLLPILINCDFLAPVLYIPSPLSKNFSLSSQNSYIKQIIELSLSLGDEMHKPVYPFIWHRYADYVDKNFTFKLVDSSQFKSFIRTVISVKYHNKAVDGVIWWNSEMRNFNYRNISNIIALQKEYLNIHDWKGHQLEVLEEYYKMIKASFN